MFGDTPFTNSHVDVKGPRIETLSCVRVIRTVYTIAEKSEVMQKQERSNVDFLTTILPPISAESHSAVFLFQNMIEDKIGHSIAREEICIKACIKLCSFIVLVVLGKLFEVSILVRFYASIVYTDFLDLFFLSRARHSRRKHVEFLKSMCLVKCIRY